MGILLPYVLAFGLWGDSAPFANRDGLFLLLFNILNGHHHERFWFVAFPKSLICRCGCAGACALMPIWEVLAWSFRCLLCALFPDERHDGTPFASSNFRGDAKRAKRAARKRKLRCKGGVVQKRGDWEWLRDILGLEGWSGRGPQGFMCFKCPCTKSLMKQFGMNASWRRRIFNQREWFFGCSSREDLSNALCCFCRGS